MCVFSLFAHGSKACWVWKLLNKQGVSKQCFSSTNLGKRQTVLGHESHFNKSYLFCWCHGNCSSKIGWSSQPRQVMLSHTETCYLRLWSFVNGNGTPLLVFQEKQVLVDLVTPSLKMGGLGENGPFSKFSLISKCNNFSGFRSYKLGSKYVLDDILALLGWQVRAPVCAPKRHTKRLKMTKKRFFSLFRRRPVCHVCAHTGVVRFTPNTSIHV